jgi:tetratricopeptide (TPR) repeat protein
MLAFLFVAACQSPTRPRPVPDPQPSASGGARVPTGASPKLDVPAPAPAQRDAALPFDVGALRFVAAQGKLVATAGDLRSAVDDVSHVARVKDAVIANGVARVTYFTDEVACGPTDEAHVLTLELSVIAARMLNAAALEHHRAGRYEEAARGFAAAVALDARFALARSNWACALARLGRTREALDALASLLRDNPVFAYAKVATDPELQSLASAAELRALEASPAPVIAHEALAHQPLVGLGGRVLAVPVRSPSWGTGAVRIDLDFIDGRDGRELHSVRLLDWVDSDDEGEVKPERRASVDARFTQTAAWMSRLGFARDPSAEAVELPASAQKVSMSRGALRFARDTGPQGVSVWRAAERIGRFAAIGRDRPARFDHLPRATVLVARWTNEDPEGCDGGDFSFAELLPVAAPATAPDHR